RGWRSGRPVAPAFALSSPPESARGGPSSSPSLHGGGGGGGSRRVLPTVCALPAGLSARGGAWCGRCAVATLDVRRALLADLPSYGALWALRLVSASRSGRTGVHSGRGLGRRLAADSELVRTRGIRLFN